MVALLAVARGITSIIEASGKKTDATEVEGENTKGTASGWLDAQHHIQQSRPLPWHAQLHAPLTARSRLQSFHSFCCGFMVILSSSLAVRPCVAINQYARASCTLACSCAQLHDSSGHSRSTVDSIRSPPLKGGPYGFITTGQQRGSAAFTVYRSVNN